MNEHSKYEISVQQWFHVGLTEKEGQALVGHIPGTKKYNLLVSYSLLPEEAKKIVRVAYDSFFLNPISTQRLP